MSKPPVDVSVKIGGTWKGDIKKLKAQLKSLEDNLKVVLKVDDNGSIEKTKGQLANIDDYLSVIANVEVNDAFAKAKLAKLDNTTTSSVHYVSTVRDDSGRFLPSGQGEVFKSGLPALHRSEKSYKPKFHRNTETLMWQLFEQPEKGVLGNFQNKKAWSRRAPGMGGQHGPFKKDWLNEGGISRKAIYRMRKAGKAADRLSKRMKGIDEAVLSLIPSYHFWISLVAAAIPALIVLGTQLLGVAAAMGAVAVAGGAMLGAGFLGMGEDLDSSLQEAQERLGDFKNELYEVFAPSFQALAPITERFLAFAPSEMSGLATSLSQLQVFEGAAAQMFSGFVNWTEELIHLLVELRPILEQVAFRFGGLLGTKVLEWIEFFTKEAYENQDSLIALADVLGDVLMMLYNVSKAVMAALISFAPLFDGLVKFTAFLDNKHIATLAKLAVGIYGVTKAVLAAVAAFRLLRNMSRAAWAATGVGLLVTAGSMAYEAGMDKGPATPSVGQLASNVGGGSAGGSTYIMNVNGNTSDEHMAEFEGMVSGHWDARQSDEEWQERPGY